ncbi:hypothetical protein CHUAL_011126 [Chamberlinius hualienensis]
MSLLSIVMLLSALIKQKIDCTPLIFISLPQLLNVASTMLCLGKVAKVKTKHFQFVRQLMVKFSEEKYLPISAIKNRINCLWWFINELITNDDHFNIGNYIPIDETIFLMLGQSVFDMTSNMCGWVILKDEDSIYELYWKETSNANNHSMYISSEDFGKRMPSYWLTTLRPK